MDRINDNEDKKKKMIKQEEIDIASGLSVAESARMSAGQANRKYYKPQYNPETRKKLYDDGKARYGAKKAAFGSGEVVHDPVTGKELVMKQRDAKLKYGPDYQNHVAEADHIDPLSQIYDRVGDKPFLSPEDIKDIANRPDCFQMLSKIINQSGRMGKGCQSNEELANNEEAMQLLAEKFNIDKQGIEEIKERLRKTGKEAVARNNRRFVGRGVKNAANTFHEAGMESAQYAAITSGALVGITNIVDVIRGDKDCEEAISDTVKITAKAGISGYVTGGGLTTLQHTLSYSKSAFIKCLSESNVPGKIITAVMTTGDSIKKYCQGEITTDECMLEIGEKGMGMITTGYTMAAGQALIPIPIVGCVVGALVGSVLSSNIYSGLIGKLQEREYEHEERMQMIKEAESAAEMSRSYRKQLEEYLEEYFADYKNCFDEALSDIHTALASGDADLAIKGANKITSKLGGKVEYETVDEFKDFLFDGNTDRL